MTVPAIDSFIGMEVYSTDIQGIDGSIKRATDQFIVEELLDNVSLDLKEVSDDQHVYPLYLLQKEGVDSSHAIKETELATGLKFKAVGLKDAKATTKQYVSSARKRKDAREHIVTKHCALDLVGYTIRPITKGNLVGNRFTITVTGFTCDNDDLERNISALEEKIQGNRIANFYGYQRFGSSRAVTHLVGREIVKRNFKEAVELFLCHPGRYDNKETIEIREACKDYSNFPKVLKIMPEQMDLERVLLQELASSNDPIKALRKLPITIRRLFVQAYQSYLFNRSLSKAIKEGYDIGSARNGDVCLHVESNNIVGIRRFSDNVTAMQLPAMPIVGYAFRDNNRFSSIANNVLEEEGIHKNDFHVKEMQELSVEGGFRSMSLLCSQFSHVLDKSLQLGFVLYKGCYATVLLRELMKPADPIAVGF